MAPGDRHHVLLPTGTACRQGIARGDGNRRGCHRGGDKERFDGSHSLTIDSKRSRLAVAVGLWCLAEAHTNWTARRGRSATVSDSQVEVICTDGVIYLGAPISSLKACGPNGWLYPQVTIRPVAHSELRGALLLIVS
jgi:hypothetical protein